MASVADPAGPELHPLNHGFVWRNREVPRPRLLRREQIDGFNRDGFLKLETAFGAGELDEVETVIDPIEAEYAELLRQQADQRIRISMLDTISFTTHIVKRSPVLQRFARHPVFTGLCYDLLGERVRLYWDQSVYKKSSKPKEFPWHQDNGYTFIEPQQYLTCWVPLNDVDEMNGCPWIAPGLHRRGTLRHWTTDIGMKCLEEVPDAVPVPAKRGDVVVFSSLSPHRTGPNLRQGTVRKAYILQYAIDGAVGVTEQGRVPQNDPERQFLVLDEQL